MKARDEEPSPPQTAIAILIEDVIAARHRLSGSHPQTARRDVVRASLAAMEGMTWVARDHVRSALAQIGQLSPIADLGLRDLSYSVSDDGDLTEQSRPLSLRTAIRLVVAQATIICPGIAVEFSRAGWSNLRQSVIIRNRITHPKPGRDLAVSDVDLVVVASALSWLVATVDYVLISTNSALTRHHLHMRDLLQRLTAGDPDALAEYRAALEQSGGD